MAAWSYNPGEWGATGSWSSSDGTWLSDADYQAMLAQEAAAKQLEQDRWLSLTKTLRNSQGQAMTNLDPNAYTFVAVDAENGADNKYAAIDSWRNSGAFYDPSAGYFTQYWIPASNINQPVAAGTTPTYTTPTNITPTVDLNPTENDWGLIPYLAPLALGLIGGGALGLFGGGALGGAGAAEAATGSTLADLYGAATGTSVLSAPTAATGSALYSAATGGQLAAALGGNSFYDLMTQPGSMIGIRAQQRMYDEPLPQSSFLGGRDPEPGFLNRLRAMLGY